MKTKINIKESNYIDNITQKYSAGTVLSFTGIANETIFTGIICSVSGTELQLINLANGNRYNEPVTVNGGSGRVELTTREIESLFRIKVLAVAVSAEFNVVY